MERAIQAALVVGRAFTSDVGAPEPLIYGEHGVPRVSMIVKDVCYRGEHRLAQSTKSGSMRAVNQSNHHCINIAACPSDGSAVMLTMAGMAAISCAHQQNALLACGGWPQGSVSLSNGVNINDQLVVFASMAAIAVFVKDGVRSTSANAAVA